jgi:hypothetical protein
VVLVGLQGIMGEIVRDALRGRPIDIVGDIDDEARLDATVDLAAADCVVWLISRSDPPAVELLYRHPRLKIVALEHDGKQAFLHELRPVRTPLGELSPDRLAEVVESAGR